MHAIRRAEAELTELGGTVPKSTQHHLWEPGSEKHPTFSKVKSFIHQHRVLLSAIRRMPPEILQEIIIWTAVARPVAEVRKRRWALAQVSRAWRGATIGLSALWAELPPLIFPTDRPRATRQVECLQEILRRSGSAPLTVTIEIDGALVTTNREKAYWSPALEMLVQHAERWETVAICMPLVSLSGMRIRGRLRSLKTLSLQIRAAYYITNEPLDMFEYAPQLQRVHIGGTFPSALKLPFAQLRHYKHLCITERNILQVANYASLESLMISQQAFGVLAFPAAFLPLLKKIEFVSNLPAQDATIHCFDALKVPALEELTVAFPFTSPSIIPSIMAMLRESGRPHLKILNIRPGTTEPLQLTALLELTPGLISLDTSCPPHFDIESLASASRLVPLVPNLRTCKFVFDFVIERYTDAPTRTALNKLAEARCEVSASDKAMTLCVYSVFNQVDDVTWSHFKQRQLEEWALTPTAKSLEKLNGSLVVHLKTWMQPRQERVLTLGKEQSVDKIRQTLTDLGNTPVRSGKDIYVGCCLALSTMFVYLPLCTQISGAHITLKRLAESDPVQDRHALAQRAKLILQKWQPLLLANPAQVRWCCQGSYSLIYIPHNHGTSRYVCVPR